MDSEAPVVPRWEWRAFGGHFPGVESQVISAAHTLNVSRETYIVSRASDANVKIRRSQLDVKRLLRLDRDLELWSPVLKATFPIAADAVANVFGHWAIAPPPLAQPHYGLDQFLSDVVAAVPQLQTIEVTKERRGASIGGCTVEVATLGLCGQTVQTVAIEAADPDQVRRVVHALGLSGHENVNYVTALKRIANGHAARLHDRAREGASP